MSKFPWPDWMKSSIDQRFNELARIASKQDEVLSLRQKQADINTRLKQVLESDDFSIILEWEEILNYRNAVEKEWMYVAGFKDGLRYYKQLHDFFMSSCVDKKAEPRE